MARKRAKTAAASEIGLGVIGLGLMGRTHIQALEHARRAGLPCRLVAVCDRSAERLTGRGDARGNVQVGTAGAQLFDPALVHTSADPRELFDDERVHALSICTPTDTHVELALAALAAGKHVLLEKPVALDPAQIGRLSRAAERAQRLVMPAMCMRFWPGWSWLKSRVEERTFGAVRSAVFQRLASPPAWSREFYGDPRRSGGALFDLHVHDVDCVHWLFGKPTSVHSTGDFDHVTTLYRFARGPRHVVAEGGWDHASGFPFRMRFVVVFEQATADFDLARTPTLLLHRDGASTPIDAGSGDGYQGEMRHFLGAILRGDATITPSLKEAQAVIRTLVAERASLTGRA